MTEQERILIMDGVRQVVRSELQRLYGANEIDLAKIADLPLAERKAFWKQREKEKSQ